MRGKIPFDLHIIIITLSNAIAQMSLKRERAGEWEVRRPRFTLGAKFYFAEIKYIYRKPNIW